MWKGSSHSAFFLKIVHWWRNWLKEPQREIRSVTIAGEEYQLITATTADLSKFLAIQEEVYQESPPWNKETFLVELSNLHIHCYLIIQKQDQPVAFIGCRVDRKDGHITHVAVCPDYENLGIATFLFGEIYRFCQNNQCRTMSLETRQSNKKAQYLYKKLGFHQRSIKKNTIVIMMKMLLIWCVI